MQLTRRAIAFALAAIAGIFLTACQGRGDRSLSSEERCLDTARQVDTGPPWAFFNSPWRQSEQVIRNRIRLLPGEKIIDAKRETFADFSTSVLKNKSQDCSIMPAHQVWVVGIRFSHPRQFGSARFAYGEATYVYDAVNGKPVMANIQGKFLSGPPFARPVYTKVKPSG